VPTLFARHSGFEPLAFGSGGEDPGVAGSTTASETARFPANREGDAVQGVAPIAGSRTPFAAPLLQARMMTVAEVSRHWGVSTATVYALVGRGELPHKRVGNSIRIDPEVVARWPGSAGKGGVR
jgi:excisionase family DNA binding protein